MFFKIIIILIIILKIYRSFMIAQIIICRKTNDFWSIIAPPGTGKTCLCAKIVRDADEKGKKVYSNVPIRGAIKIDIKKDLGTYQIENAAIIIDEAGSELNNRNWHSNLTDSCVEYIKKHRHYNVDIYCFSQAPNDMDNKFRDLVTRVYLLQKSFFPFFVKAISLRKIMKLESGVIVQYLEEDRINNFKYFIPPTWAYFNSYDQSVKLKPMNEKIYNILDIK